METGVKTNIRSQVSLVLVLCGTAWLASCAHSEPKYAETAWQGSGEPPPPGEGPAEAYYARASHEPDKAKARLLRIIAKQEDLINAQKLRLAELGYKPPAENGSPSEGPDDDIPPPEVPADVLNRIVAKQKRLIDAQNAEISELQKRKTSNRTTS